MYRRLYLTGIPVYIFMFLLSVFFYKERIILCDTAFNLFYIIKEHSFYILNYRFGDFFSQVLPVVAVKLQMPLHTIMASYSISFIVYYFLCYFITGSVLKKYDFALVILMLNILIVAHVFYWIPSELPQGIALLIVALAAVSGKPLVSVPAAVFMVCAIVTVVFFHPLVSFALFYVILFFYDTDHVYIPRKVLLAVATIFVATLIVKDLAFRTPYEQHALGGLRNFARLFPNYLSTYSSKQFAVNCVKAYYWLPVGFALITAYYLWNKAYKRLAIFSGFFIVYLFLVNVAFATSQTPVFYMENLYLLLAFFLALPVIFDLLPALEKRKLALPFFLLILVTGCVRIYETHDTYTARLDLERRVLDEYGKRKVLVQANEADDDTLLMLWGTPYEILLLSQVERNKPASILIDRDARKWAWANTEKKALIVNWNIIPYKDIDPHYFPFSDTTTGYEVVSGR